VRWIGTLIGPGSKNPSSPGQVPRGGIAAFSFVVDSTAEVRSAAALNCSRP
jgi:hypothetical protein